MSRVPELYNPEADAVSRDEGLVYIEDLPASHVLLALKKNCAPQGLGFLHAEPVTDEMLDELHADMVWALDASNRELAAGFRIGEISVRSWYDDPNVIKFTADYWEGRPLKTTLTTGPNVDRELLTGFVPFSPWGFDRDQGQGEAQKTIDALRVEGTAEGIALETLIGTRDLGKAQEARGKMLPEDPMRDSELDSMLRKILDRYDRLREE